MSTDQVITTTGPGWPDDDWQIQPGGQPLALKIDTAHDEMPCLQRRHKFTCARPAGHTGRHVATGRWQLPPTPLMPYGRQVEHDEQGRSMVLEVWS